MRAKNDVITRTDQSIGAAVETDKTKSIAACPIQGIGCRSFQGEHGIPISPASRSRPFSCIPRRLNPRNPPPPLPPSSVACPLFAGETMRSKHRAPVASELRKRPEPGESARLQMTCVKEGSWASASSVMSDELRPMVMAVQRPTAA